MRRDIYLLTGTNLGDRRRNLQQAGNMLKIRGVEIISSSLLYETASWGVGDQPDYLNQVLHVGSTMTPMELLAEIQQIELAMGRERKKKWESRIIDIDILLFGNLVLDTPSLKVPHPEIQNRRFTLVPLGEIAPGYIHPVFGKTISQLLEECVDDLSVSAIPLLAK